MVKEAYNRRQFLSSLSIGWIFLSGALGGAVSAIYRYLYPNVNFEPEMEVLLGTPDQFSPGVDERFKSSHGLWVVKLEGQLYALSTICTHLGCVPNWTPSSSTFECPCHGSGYYTSGINFKGPAPRPLERYQISLTPEGIVKVDKTKVFRQEKGQWSNLQSYISV